MAWMLPFFLAISIFTAGSVSAASVRLNEIQANTMSEADPAGRIAGWIELYNLSETGADLAGLEITGSAGLDGHFVFPANSIIDAHGYLVIACDPGLPASSQNTGFGLRRTGGLLQLSQGALSSGALIDAITFGVQAAGFSIGRLPEAAGLWVLTVPTPGSQNVRADVGTASVLRINEWSAHGGTSADYVELYNPGTLPVELTGLHLTDSLNLPNRFTIGPLSFIGTGRIGGFAIFVADDRTAAGPNHLNFALKESGESLGLFDGRLAAIHSLAFGAQANGGSEGFLPDGSSQRVVFTNSASPGAYNRFPGPLRSVVINELLPHTDPPLEDAIEFYNTTGKAMRLEGSRLTLIPAPEVDFESPKTYRITDPVIIEPYGYAVLYQYQFGAQGMRFNSAHGGTLIFTLGDDNGFAVEIGEQTFGPSRNGVSFGRYRRSDGIEEFVPMMLRSFGVDAPKTVAQFREGHGKPNSMPYVPLVIVSELMCRPLPGDDEYIELRNTSPYKFLLYDAVYPNNRWRLRGDVEFDGFPLKTALAPGGFLTLVPFDPAAEPARLQAFRTRYQVPAAVPVYGPYIGSLQRTSGTVELIRPDTPQSRPHPDAGFVPYLTMEKIAYQTESPWPGTGVGSGLSLQRRNPFAYANEPINWKAAPPTAGRPNGVLPAITLQPQSQALIPGQPVTFSVAATGEPPLQFQWRFNGTNIPEATSPTLTLEQPTSASGGRYSVVITGEEGSIESQMANLKIDQLVPALTIDSPKNASRVFSSLITVQGQARDDVGVATVRLTVNGRIQEVRPEGEHWAAQVELAPGTNAISAVAIDAAGNASRQAGVSIGFVVLSPIHVFAGNGVVLPSLDGTELEIGRIYTAKATPNAGYLFSAWRNGSGIISRSPSLSFVMTSNLVLTADFIANPYLSRAGSYAGLFLDSPPTPAGSGFISLKLGTSGSWSATVRRGSVSGKAAGSLGAEGVSTNRISFGSDPALTLELALQLDSIGGELTGRVVGSGVEAPLLALRSYANREVAYPRAGAYTFIIPGTNAAGRFAGDGFGSIIVDSRGMLAVSASLADAAKAVQKVFVSADNQWPLYVPLDGGRGLLAGWISFGDFGNEDGQGTLRWLKAADSERLLYPDGFTNQVSLTASRYDPTRYPTGRLVGFETGTLGFDGDEVPGWSDEIDWSADNRITSKAGHPLAVRITAKTGLYTGQWTGADGQPVSFRGAIHQSDDFAAGYFIHSNATGRAWLHPNE